MEAERHGIRRWAWMLGALAFGLYYTIAVAYFEPFHVAGIRENLAGLGNLIGFYLPVALVLVAVSLALFRLERAAHRREGRAGFLLRWVALPLAAYGVVVALLWLYGLGFSGGNADRSDLAGRLLGTVALVGILPLQLLLLTWPRRGTASRGADKSGKADSDGKKAETIGQNGGRSSESKPQGKPEDSRDGDGKARKGNSEGIDDDSSDSKSRRINSAGIDDNSSDSISRKVNSEGSDDDRSDHDGKSRKVNSEGSDHDQGKSHNENHPTTKTHHPDQSPTEGPDAKSPNAPPQPTFRLQPSHGESTFEILAADLILAEAADNYCKLYYLLNGQSRTKMVRVTMRDVEAALSGLPGYHRCHRSFLVNAAMVEAVQGQSQAYRLKVRHVAEPVPVSRSFDVELLRAD